MKFRKIVEILLDLPFWINLGNSTLRIVQMQLNISFKGPLLGERPFLAAKILLKIMKNVFYFMLKRFYVLDIFKLFSWLFGRVGKWLDKKAKFHFKIWDVKDCQTSSYNNNKLWLVSSTYLYNFCWELCNLRHLKTLGRRFFSWRPDKTAGYNINVNVIKKTYEELKTPLMWIFNLPLSRGIFF